MRKTMLVTVAGLMILALGCHTKAPAVSSQDELKQREDYLKHIVLATRQVAIDDVQSGRYPPDIRSLVQHTDLTAASFVMPGRNGPPLANKQAEAEWAQRNSDYAYLGGGLTDAVYADIVLAHEKPELLPDDALIGVAYADGSVAFLPRLAFQKALYTYARYRQQLASNEH